MKFGYNLPRNQVPEWAASYIDYKALKRIVKNASSAEQSGRDVDVTEFFFTLDRNLEVVDSFYNKKYAECTRTLRLLHDRYGHHIPGADGFFRDEAEDLMGALLDLRGQLRKLQWYGEVNRRGFAKITKKFDKKVSGAAAQQTYLASKIDPKAFAQNTLLADVLKEVNEWLSSLGEPRPLDDTSSIRSTGSVTSKAIVGILPALLDQVDLAIKNDDASVLENLLPESSPKDDQGKVIEELLQKLLIALLQRSISSRSKKCIDLFLSKIVSLADDDDVHKRNCIHKMVISIGRSKDNDTKSDCGSSPSSWMDPQQLIFPAETPNWTPRSRARSGPEDISIVPETDSSAQLLLHILQRLENDQRQGLTARDSFGRTPLHYAAQYGLSTVCEILVQFAKEWNLYLPQDSNQLRDSDGLTPLQLSVINEHLHTTKALLSAEDPTPFNDSPTETPSKEISAAILTLAAKNNSAEIIKVLLEAGFDVNHQDNLGETALHVAARYGHEETVRVLLEGTASQTTNIDVPENTFAWTPLFLACVEGHFKVSKLLMQAGADLERLDSSGWTAREHAALRGHMDIAKFFTQYLNTPDSSDAGSLKDTPASPPNSYLLEERKAKAANEGAAMRPYKYVKSFGHRYLTKETMVLVSLGTMDSRKQVNPVNLDAIPLADAHATQLDTALSIVVSATGAEGESVVIDLPPQENINTDPITFLTTDVSKVKVLFDIVPTYAGSKEKIVGRGVALLSRVKPHIGTKRMNLQGDISVPIVAANTLDVIGSVNFNFLVITPFHHPNMAISKQHTYWKSVTSPMVIGHRGLGKNVGARKSLQLGENTIQSFIAAANLGASYVEFDVQLTKDHVPVIYHDFLVSETGIDAPVHTLTLEQFLHISDSQIPRESRPSSPKPRLPTNHASPFSLPSSTSDSSAMPSQQQRRPRSYSAGHAKEDRSGKHLTDRMKYTRDFRLKGFKANVRGDTIQAPFATLDDMFRKLPESVGFNIEMKYPMLFESEDHEMDTYAVELNEFVDTVLATVFEHLGPPPSMPRGRLGEDPLTESNTGIPAAPPEQTHGRHIIFSSFNPDICLLLSFKQPSIPVLFLTDAGTEPAGDVRAQSLQAAIRFASRWNLLGIVSAAEPLVLCPRLVRVVKGSGLVCVSYGVLNNDTRNVEAQVGEGIDAVIVDNVLAIRKGLTEVQVGGKVAASGAGRVGEG